MGASEAVELYTTVGVTGVVVALFAFMIKNLINSQGEQSEDLESIKQSIAKQESELNNTMNITIKLIDSINEFKKDVNDKLDRRHEKIVDSIDDISDSVNYIQGRLNGNKRNL
tara:strand:+ start:335 stop:673 length:339 start_codon:yes stop_codon:yes gene_type:complete